MIDVMRDGGWPSLSEFHAMATSAAAAASDLTLNLQGLHSLDAGSLQIMMGLIVEQKRLGRMVRLANTAPELSQWFEHAGCGSFFARQTFDPEPLPGSVSMASVHGDA